MQLLHSLLNVYKDNTSLQITVHRSTLAPLAPLAPLVLLGWQPVIGPVTVVPLLLRLRQPPVQL